MPTGILRNRACQVDHPRGSIQWDTLTRSSHPASGIGSFHLSRPFSRTHRGGKLLLPALLCLPLCPWTTSHSRSPRPSPPFRLALVPRPSRCYGPDAIDDVTPSCIDTASVDLRSLGCRAWIPPPHDTRPNQECSFTSSRPPPLGLPGGVWLSGSALRHGPDSAGLQTPSAHCYGELRSADHLPASRDSIDDSPIKRCRSPATSSYLFQHFKAYGSFLRHPATVIL